MRYLLSLILLLTCVLPAFASQQIVKIPADGSLVFPNNEREFVFANHSDNADFHLYGSNKWAVRFNFPSMYPGITDCTFSISKARIYFPILGDSVQVSLYSEAASLPSQLITTAKVLVDANVLDIPFPTTVQAQVVWLVVDYTTNFQTRFVAASQGDGSHSYYLNTSAVNPYFQNMLVAGLNCELLFGLLGNFNIDTPDLQLISFGFPAKLRPRESVSPVFSIYNHSTTPVSDARLTIEIGSPDSSFVINQTIDIPATIDAQSLYEVEAPGLPGYSFDLPQGPMQLRIKAAISSSLAESNITLVNNSISKVYNVFSYNYPIHLVENFSRVNMVNVIGQAQDSYANPAFHPLTYLPSLSDSLSNLASYQRLEWYGINSLPSTMFNGAERIYGFLALDYPDRFQSAATAIQTDRSFISSSNCSLVENPNESITVDISISNSNTKLYASVTDNPVLSSRFFVGLFKKTNFGGINRYVLDRWIVFADTINSTLRNGGTATKTYNLSLLNLSVEELRENFRIYYWLQDKNGGVIYYTNNSDFADLAPTSVNDSYIPTAIITAYPNPLRPGKSLYLQNLPLRGSVNVYNIKGQCVWSADLNKSELAVPQFAFTASGIYFLKTSDASGKHLNTIKVSYIK